MRHPPRGISFTYQPNGVFPVSSHSQSAGHNKLRDSRERHLLVSDCQCRDVLIDWRGGDCSDAHREGQAEGGVHEDIEDGHDAVRHTEHTDEDLDNLDTRADANTQNSVIVYSERLHLLFDPTS